MQRYFLLNLKLNLFCIRTLIINKPTLKHRWYNYAIIYTSVILGLPDITGYHLTAINLLLLTSDYHKLGNTDIIILSSNTI